MTNQFNSNGWEVEVCSRCGGTGHYSFNLMTGTRCFGCNGQKVKMTRIGKLARQKFIDAMTTTAKNIKVGDFISETGRIAWKKVREVEHTGEGEDARIHVKLKSGGTCYYPDSKILREVSHRNFEECKGIGLKYQFEAITRQIKKAAKTA